MYLFAGKRRQSDVASFLQRAHDEGRINLTLKEYDLELSPDHDLTDLSIWEDIWATLAEGGWTLIVSPPCNTFSRARFHFQDWPGPRPLRNINWPRGFPWLSQHHRAVVEEANLFIDRCIKACLACHSAGGKFIIEHPEDLGLVRDERPGSIWQLAEILDLIPSCGAVTFAIQQCHFGAPTPKPTRFLGTLTTDDKRCHAGLPRFDKVGAYKGPLPKSCGHSHKHKLLGKTANKWNTSPSASYPPGLCEFLAALVLNAVHSFGRGNKNQQGMVKTFSAVNTTGEAKFTTPGGSFSAGDAEVTAGGGSSSKETGKNITCAKASAGGGSSSTDTPFLLAEKSGTADNSSVVDLTLNETEEPDGFDMEKCCNYGSPIKVEWDGKVHDFIDGFGLCSPTRWHPRARGHKRSSEMKQLASQTFQCLRDGVSEALQDVRREAFKLVTGKLQSSPFSEDLLMKVRKRIAALLRDAGDAVVRDTGQPFYLRLLAQWLEVFQDPDVDCLVNSSDSFATGVNVGVEDPLPRSPQVFPPKVKHRKLDDVESFLQRNSILFLHATSWVFVLCLCF